MGEVLGIFSVPVLIGASVIYFLVKRYRRCPSNKILVIYGRVGKDKSAICIHGGGTFVWPLIQDSQFLSLEPMTIEINLTGALSKQNILSFSSSSFYPFVWCYAPILFQKMLQSAEGHGH